MIFTSSLMIWLGDRGIQGNQRWMLWISSDSWCNTGITSGLGTSLRGSRGEEYPFLSCDNLSRLRRNMIIRLKNDQGVWCEDEIQLKDMAAAFYQRLYSAEPVTLCVP